MSSLSEIEPELLAQVTGGVSRRIASGGKSGDNSQAVLMVIEQLKSAIAELKGRGNEGLQMMFQMMMKMHGGNGGKPAAAEAKPAA